MKSKETILKRIAKHEASIKKFRLDKKTETDKFMKLALSRAIFTLQTVNRELKNILK
jgi:hypothetical protein